MNKKYLPSILDSRTHPEFDVKNLGQTGTALRYQWSKNW